MPLVGGFGCPELVLYGIRELAQQHYEPLILLQSEITVLKSWRFSLILGSVVILRYSSVFFRNSAKPFIPETGQRLIMIKVYRFGFMNKDFRMKTAMPLHLFKSLLNLSSENCSLLEMDTKYSPRKQRKLLKVFLQKNYIFAHFLAQFIVIALYSKVCSELWTAAQSPAKEVFKQIIDTC